MKQSSETNAETHDEQTIDAVMAELGRLRSEVESLRRERVDTTAAVTRPETDVSSGSRRQLFRLAGASAVGAVAASTIASRPAAAADPNDVVKNISNPVVDTTTLDGDFPGPVLSLFNRSLDAPASAIYVSADAASPAIRADNSATGGAGGVALGGNAPGGRDVFAFGSGRIAMADHDFGEADEYAPGEIHQSGGDVYAMVTPYQRRKLAGPSTAGALHTVTPTRVYDSRTPWPAPGRLDSGEQRLVSVAHGRSIEDGSLVAADVVPSGATAIYYTLTITNTADAGYLYVAPPSATSVSASTINWTDTGTVRANSSLVGISDDREIKVFCSPTGSTHFVIDVIGYCA